MQSASTLAGEGHNPRVLRWSLFDVASSTYAALVPTYFGLYFVSVLGAGHPGVDALWGATAAVALLVTGLLAPVAGAWADRKAGWLRVIGAATVLCVVATLLLAQAPALGLVGAALMFVLAQAGYTLATSQYDALLLHVARPGQLARSSALGWSIGLLGGLVALGGGLWLMHDVPAAQQGAHLEVLFLLAGALFAVLGAPALLALRGAVPPRGNATDPGPAAGVFAALSSVWQTCRQWRRHRTAFVLLGGFFLINDVLVTLQFFSGILLRERFAIEVHDLLWLSVLFHVVALPSTLLAGSAADRIGAPRALAAMCALLGAAVVLLALGTASWTPAAAAVLLGLVFASLQAVFRALYAAHVPPQQMAELFGFNAVTSRMSAALGPLIFGAVTMAIGAAGALLVLLVPLAIGALVLLRVPAASTARR